MLTPALYLTQRYEINIDHLTSFMERKHISVFPFPKCLTIPLTVGACFIKKMCASQTHHLSTLKFLSCFLTCAGMHMNCLFSVWLLWWFPVCLHQACVEITMENLGMTYWHLMAPRLSTLMPLDTAGRCVLVKSGGRQGSKKKEPWVTYTTQKLTWKT